MRNKIYKVVLALLDNKLLAIDGVFMLSYNIVSNKYMIWYLDNHSIPRVFDCCDTKDIMEFKWNILMSRKGI